MDDSATAYPLDDSDLSVSATGVVFAEPQGHEVYLVANGLPGCHAISAIRSGCSPRTTSCESAGLLTAGADGDLRALLQTPAPFTDYVGLALTAEPDIGKRRPDFGSGARRLVPAGYRGPAVLASLIRPSLWCES